MDGKGQGSRPSGNGQARKRSFVFNNVKDQRRIITFCKTHRSALLSGSLIVAIVALLIGIFAQFQGPVANDAPTGETSINYSVFLNQVNSGNVLAVTLRGNDINAFLQEPLAASKTKPVVALSAAQRTAQLAQWTSYVGSLNSGSMDAPTSTIDPTRLVYTALPADGMAQLMPLLLNQHVSITTQPVQQTPGWLSIIWKFAPLLFLVVLLSIVLAPRKQGRLPQNVNEHIAQFTKKRLKRFDGTGTQKPKEGQGKQVSG
ncbi:MAG TPA: ATP-dependent metallopeptidase FtsH/Yme1/Tma family protein, partial [Ktedonobacteraceae bacterium]